MENKTTAYTATSAYVFKNTKGNKLTLEVDNKNLRYRFKGSKIPFPIYGGTWFVGLGAEKMVKAIEETGYSLKVKVNYITGKVNFYNEF